MHSPSVPLRSDWVAWGYTLLAALGAGTSWAAHNHNPLLFARPVLHLAPWSREACSLVAGGVLGILVIASTRIAVARTTWARQLHEELRPVTHGMTNLTIVVLALFSSLGEELFFRSLLTPWLGIVLQALVFGLVHQVKGYSRWIWVTWASCVGLVIGGIYVVFGTLSGPLFMHALINVVNLAYLRDYEPIADGRPMGGLLGSSRQDGPKS